MENVLRFLKEADVYYLATVEGDQPRVRPFGTVNLYEGKLYIQTGKIKPVSKQLMTNPKAEICAFKDGKWLRIACELIEDDSLEARKSMLDAYQNLRAMYDENDGNTQVFYMKNAVATFSSFTEEPVVIKF
ncbi:MAG: NimC/NimA family protein [Ruminococcus sp.]|nr:NimC/NimA family protein [Ruminococcus sp.]